MTKILISLVSKQTTPNVLAIKELPGIDEYVFICTMQMQSQLDSIIETTQINSKELQTIIVEAVSIKQINTALEKAVLLPTHQYYINLTGGTKIMALATFQYFVSYPNIKMFYLGSKDKTFQFIYPEIEDLRAIRYQLNIKEFLMAYGLKLQESSGDNQFSAIQTIQHYQRFLQDELYGKPLKVIKELSRCKLNHQNRLILNQEQSEILHKLGFYSNQPQTISIAEKDYLRGKWLEEYVFNLIKKYGQLSNDFLAHSLKIDNGSMNELDVFFMYKNTPFYFECKTTVQNGADFSKSIYKLAALRDTLGIDLQLVLILLTDVKERFGKYLNDNPFNRAANHQVKVIDRKDVSRGELESFIEAVFMNK